MTGQVLDSPVASLVLPVLMRPILSNLERQDMAASQTLRAALSKVKPEATLVTRGGGGSDHVVCLG